MNRQALFFLLTITIFFLYIPASIHAAEEERVLILFKENADQELIEDADGEVSREMENIPAITATVPEEAVAELEKDPNVLAVEEDIRVSATGQITDWGISRINAPAAQASGLTGKGIKIAVLDTGIAVHDDLHIAGGISFASYTKNYQDDNGHGTFVAGIIGAADNAIGGVGAAPEASLYAVKVLDQYGLGYLSDVIEGIDWSIEQGMDIINLSLSTDVHSQMLKEIVDQAYQNNILVVASGGNNGTSNVLTDNVNYPARYDSVIAVGATDAADLRADFSVTGPAMEITAPGVDIESTFLYNQYGYMSGTSMAAPFVAANLALLKQLYGPVSARELRLHLQQNVLDLGLAGRDNLYGFGLLQTPALQQAAAIVDPASYTRTGITLDAPTVVYNRDGSQLKTISQGVRVRYKLFSEDSYQALVTVNGKYQAGYIRKTDLERITTTPLAKRGITLKSSTNVYSRASTGGRVVKSYPVGTVLEYRTYTSNWYAITVTVDGKRKTAYLPKSAVENAVSNPASLKGIALNSPTKIYQRASTGSTVIKSFSAGTILKYRGFTSKWYEITVTVNGTAKTGYLPKTTVEKIFSQSTALKGKALNSPTKVYLKPASGATVIKKYSQGTVLSYRSFSANWHKKTVYVNGKAVTGYIRATHVRTYN